MKAKTIFSLIMMKRIGIKTIFLVYLSTSNNISRRCNHYCFAVDTVSPFNGLTTTERSTPRLCDTLPNS